MARAARADYEYTHEYDDQYDQYDLNLLVRVEDENDGLHQAHLDLIFSTALSK